MNLAIMIVLLGCCTIQAFPADDSDADVRVIAYLGTPCLPAAHAHVAIKRLGISARTDSLGVAVLPGVPSGRHELSIAYPGLRRGVYYFRIEPHARSRIITIDLGTLMSATDIGASPVVDCEGHPVHRKHPQVAEDRRRYSLETLHRLPGGVRET